MIIIEWVGTHPAIAIEVAMVVLVVLVVRAATSRTHWTP